MLKDKYKIKRIIQALRYAVKNNITIKFKEDRAFKDVLVIESGNNKTDGQYQVLNSLFLFRQDK